MDAELIFWIVSGIVGVVGFCAFWIMASRDVGYVDEPDRESRYVRGSCR